MSAMAKAQRSGSVIGLRESAIEEYERHHREVWPEVLAAISAAGIRNYSIYRYGTLLFSYWEYEGDDYEGDLAAIDQVPACVRWNDLMATLQVPVDGARPRAWLPVPEVFHLD
ncbi:L-rhamnose mutarotase [Microbacterium sp. BH-3-3-3]|uniref:L-rhamnose mutarotase n=1 Tax=Microbacterium sp. BH-3-3-3 TaxID=1906742 RepID=UPI0021B26649|nr:L-rhamnose mutarotase [Microbacterium sp. BH-3-3-3]